MDNFLNGFRIEIQAINNEQAVLQHFSGYSELQIGSVFHECPNCKNQMFPAINIDCLDRRLTSFVQWQERYINVLFCPFCDFYMKPYWLRFENGRVVDISGGKIGIRTVLQNIETPYRIREACLRELTPEERPTSDFIRNQYRRRAIPPGVYHQLGGLPITGDRLFSVCPYCDAKARFAGILDYDDLNIPLYENSHKPVALIIGDGNSMNFYICMKCTALGLEWVY
jgi:hypothetical protein